LTLDFGIRIHRRGTLTQPHLQKNYFTRTTQTILNKQSQMNEPIIRS
ncbi:MAG: hypothetical protein ACI814_004587, partial [Mariniblastus sp.]